MQQVICAVGAAANWVFRGPIAGFLPTLLGTFLGFLLGSLRSQRSDRGVFRAMVNFSFVELNETIRYIGAHSNLIKSGGHHALAARPRDFIKGNMIAFPTSLASLTTNGQLSRFANTALWADLFNRISGLRIIWGQVTNSDYSSFDELLVSYGNLASMIMEVEWRLYCIARNTQIPYDPAAYGKLIATIQQSKDRPLHLEGISPKQWK